MHDAMHEGNGERTVAVTAARALMDFALSKGVSRAALTERSGIDPADLRNDDNQVPFARYVALMKAGKELSNDPAFGLHFGESAEGMESTFACMMGIFSPTMADTFAHLRAPADPSAGDDANDGDNGERLRLTRHGDEIWIVETWKDDDLELAESRFARAVCAARRLFPAAEFIKSVQFAHAEPTYRAEYDRIFGMPIVFGSEHNALVTDASWLEWKPQEPSRHVFEIVKERANTLLLERQDAAYSTRRRVEVLLTNLMHTPDVSVESVAGKLGMGRHTLLRKLKAEGVTFKQVLDELRHKLAIQYLSENNMAVNETAYLLGFSDPTAFSRAYKRWTGHSPRRVK